MQTPIRTENGFKRLASSHLVRIVISIQKGNREEVCKAYKEIISSRLVATLCTDHCNTCVAPDVRAVLI